MNKPRVSGRKVALGLLAIIGAILTTAITLWWRTREPKGPIASMAVLDDHTVVLARRGVSQRDYIHIQARDLRQIGQRWSIALFSTQPGAHPIIVDDRVSLRVRDAQGRPETHVFDVNEGRFAFRAGAVNPVSNELLDADETAVGASLFVAYGTPVSKAFMIDVPTGTVRFTHTLASGDRHVRVAIAGEFAYLEDSDGHVRALAKTDGVTSDLGLGTMCAAGTRAFVLSPSGRLDVRAQAPSQATLEDVGEAPRLSACAGDDTRALLVVTSGAGVAKTALFAVDASGVRRVGQAPLRVAEGFGTARALPEATVYVIPFENGYVGLFDIAGVQRAMYRVRNARAPLDVRSVEGGAVLPMGERILVVLDGTPHLVRVEPEEGSGVLVDAAVRGHRLFLAVERQVLSLDTRRLTLLEHTGDLTVSTEPATSLLSRVPSP